ncbi:hypothetical protein CDEST_05633 [Colletotrichum destructivum]|uniref:Uncharacterized protein n=1 Tax=Colletotrichum destructivum TaxID=34406 RepID=A0AAX4ICC2_9PEZI|nr:hypothetical protein CDEST_05633 [Colletotrichum destructivum]
MNIANNWFLVAWAITNSVSPASAQASNTSSLDSCPQDIQSIANGRARYNSTGSTSFNLGQEDDWQLSYGLQDMRAENFRAGHWVTMQYLSTFLSVPASFISSPRGSHTRICSYRMPGQNKTLDDQAEGASGSCEGVLSDECIQALLRAPPPVEDDCPRIDPAEACGFGVIVGRVAPSNFSSGTCTLDGLRHIDLPESYRTYSGLVGGSILPADRTRESFEAYDLRVRQPIPMLITSSVANSDERHAAVVCLAPSNVTDGSRVPEGEFPPSAASVLSFRRNAIWASVAACVVIVALV